MPDTGRQTRLYIVSLVPKLPSHGISRAFTHASHVNSYCLSLFISNQIPCRLASRGNEIRDTARTRSRTSLSMYLAPTYLRPQWKPWQQAVVSSALRTASWFSMVPSSFPIPAMHRRSLNAWVEGLRQASQIERTDRAWVVPV